jgi:hypothetical protein
MDPADLLQTSIPEDIVNRCHDKSITVKSGKNYLQESRICDNQNDLEFAVFFPAEANVRRLTLRAQAHDQGPGLEGWLRHAEAYWSWAELGCFCVDSDGNMEEATNVDGFPGRVRAYTNKKACETFKTHTWTGDTSYSEGLFGLRPNEDCFLAFYVHSMTPKPKPKPRNSTDKNPGWQHYLERAQIMVDW